MVPVTLYYGHIQVGVSVGEQVGEALLCPSSNLLDQNQWRLRDCAIPRSSNTIPSPYVWDSDEGHGLDDRAILYIELLHHRANAPMCFSVCPRQDQTCLVCHLILAFQADWGEARIGGNNGGICTGIEYNVKG